jgi:hypothetical protein
MSLETAVQGAKYQSFQRCNPRDILNRLHAENSDAAEATLMGLCWDELQREENHDYLVTMFRYWWLYNYKALCGPSRQAAPRLHDIERIKEKMIYGIVISLNFIMPNGKPLSQNTGGECLEIGGYFARIGAKVPKDELVGDILSDDEIRKCANA